MNLLKSPEMIPVFLTLGALLIAIVGVLYIGFSSISIKSVEKRGSGKNSIPADFRDQFIKAYNKVFSTFNMQPMNGMLTDFMYYSTQNTVNILKKLGIRKEVSVEIDHSYDQFNQTNMVIADGKNDMSLDLSHCKCTETYYDEHTNKKIFRRIIKKAIYNIEFLRSSEKLKNDITCCMNCGDTLVKHGNFFDCPSCGAHYDWENLKWSASNVSIEPDSTGSSRLIGFAIVGFVLLSVVEMILKNKILGFIISGIDILFILATLLYIRWAWKALSIMKEMKAKDPKASQMVFNKRVYYLIRTLEMARDWKLSDIKPFMSPELYTKIKQNNEYDDYYVVDLTFKKIIPTGYRVKDQIQIIDFDIVYDQLLMNPKKKIKQSKQKRHYALYKSVNALTKVNASAQAIVCPNCGANINRITEGVCSYCNASIDVADFDWVFYDAPIEMTK